jgi:hypothetical protein
VSRRHRDGFGLGVLGSLLVIALLVDLGFTIEVRLDKPSQQAAQVDVASAPTAAPASDEVPTSSRRSPTSVASRPGWHARSTVQR